MVIPRNLWSPQDTLNLKRITNIDVSPNGKRVAFTVTQAVMTTEKSSYLSQVYLADSDGNPPEQLTIGEFSSFAPQWSPDGRSIAFLSRNNIWLMSLRSKNVQKVTDVATSVSSFKWSPDGSMIAFTAVGEPTPEEAQAALEKNDPHIVDMHEKKRRLYLVSLAEISYGPSRGRPLTGNDIHVGAPEVPETYNCSPDCKTIVFAHCRSPQQNDWPSTRLARLNLEDGSIQPMGPDEAVTFNPVISPDGQWVACKVYDDPAWEWSSLVHVLPLAGGPARPLAETYDRRPDLLGWSGDGKWLYCLEIFGTRFRLYALPVDGNPPVVLLDPAGCIENASLNITRSALGFTLQTTAEPMEVYLTQLDSISPVQMSQVNAEFRPIPMGRTEVIHWKSIDGLEIEGLLTYPIGYERDRRYPLLVSVHGGPPIAWGQAYIGMQSFYGPIAAFAEHGYAILRCNVRGSTGYGKAFRRANYRDWGGKDVQDLLAGVDHVIGLGVADPGRLFITGWSYGGYLTAATITQTGRFRAAVIGAGMADLVSYALGNDSPDFLPSHFGGEVWEVADLLLERSPIAHANRVTTPTLILHGENDQRVPIWQGYELYNALKRLGVPAQMVVYPRTGHVPSEPKLLLDVMNRILAWMDLFLLKPATNTLDGKSISTTELEAFIERIMEKAEVAGLSCAILNDSQIVYQKAFGYKNKNDGTLNDEETVFSAASFSKAVFAYLVMLLAEDGVINLDKPLYEYLARPLYQYPAYADLAGDEQYTLITARMVLSHSTGFPNLRSLMPDGRLQFLFSPGERYSYSGEGINLLQMVIEEMTGKDLETLAQEKIFHPLGMTRSSYVWQAAYEDNIASPHDEFNRPRGLSIQQLQQNAGAGGSMATTAGDYARFISLGILNVGGKRKTTIDEMLRSQIAIHYKQMFGPGAWQETDQYQDIRLAWGLGWGRFDTPYGRAFFHTGHGPGWQNYTVTYADKGTGIVLLSNSDNFESVAQEIVTKAIGDVYTPFGWLGYIPFDPSRPKTTPPPDPVIIEVDPAILGTYAGTYDFNSTALFQIKFEDNKLWILSKDGKNWNRLYAETEARFLVKDDETYRFEFIRDASGNVTALRLEIQGIPLLVAPKILSE